MKLFYHHPQSAGDIALYPKTIAAIGNFDGVHRGHQALLTTVKTLSIQKNLPLLIVVFEPQTREYFLKDQAPPRLTTLRKKLQLFKQFDVDFVCCLRFDHNLAKMSATDFAQKVIFLQLQVKHLLVGHDFRFGCDKEGDVALLQQIGHCFHAQVDAYPDVVFHGQRVSSTLIRQALKAGHLEDAKRWLGRPYALCGRVIYGDGRAGAWGIPTANIKLHQNILPLQGVFFVQVRLLQGQIYWGVANIGHRPTVDGTRALLEVHILEFAQSLYGQRIEVTFLHKWRDEIRFAAVDQLIRQIHQDIAAAKAYFLEQRLC
ncbi:MAG TPA: bifunctional riboflavin kinase/FAD synthetase [Legionellaceae bacterium]|nr:bifunctional riboflavin kinase/FAD synthetase [Legionellaceae bacterium]